jgi:hypothetical protein
MTGRVRVTFLKVKLKSKTIETAGSKDDLYHP